MCMTKFKLCVVYGEMLNLSALSHFLQQVWLSQQASVEKVGVDLLKILCGFVARHFAL